METNTQIGQVVKHKLYVDMHVSFTIIIYSKRPKVKQIFQLFFLL